MDERKDFTDAAGGNGDWSSWKRLIVVQISSLQEKVKELEASHTDLKLETLVLQTKITIYAAIVAIVSNAVFSWLMKNIQFG